MSITIKFELKPNNRNATDEDLLKDLQLVASNLGLNSLSQKDYKEHGRFSCDTLTRRFGSWVDVLKSAGLEVENYHSISDEELLNNLKTVADSLRKKTVTTSEYRTLGKYSPDPFVRRFGSWSSGLKKAGLEKSRNLNITTEELFENLGEIWIKLGRQPSCDEVSKPLSKYSKDVYIHRFSSWRKALEAFVKNVNDDEKKAVSETITTKNSTSKEEDYLKHKTSRNINLRLRFIVMKRDNFKCKKCGRSPSVDPTTILHIDHIKPYSKGGETVLENLETLCSICNLGKSDLE